MAVESFVSVITSSITVASWFGHAQHPPGQCRYGCESKDAQANLSKRCTCKGVSRRCEEIEERHAVQGEAPIGVEYGIENEAEGCGNCYDAHICVEYRAYELLSYPYVGKQEQAGQEHEITGHRQVNAKTMKHDGHHFCKYFSPRHL